MTNAVDRTGLYIMVFIILLTTCDTNDAVEECVAIEAAEIDPATLNKE